jgi:hypothetical protein
MLFCGDGYVGIRITGVRAVILCNVALSTKLHSAAVIRDSDLCAEC